MEKGFLWAGPFYFDFMKYVMIVKKCYECFATYFYITMSHIIYFLIN